MLRGTTMSMDDLYAKPGHLIRRAHQIVVGMFMEECAAFDITPVQYACLIAARENPGLDATRLSYLIAFDRSTLGKVLDRLTDKGLIRRASGAQDRLISRLPAKERRTFMSTLTRLVELNNEYSRAPLRVVGNPD